jgi:hypothetical protein
MKKLIDRFSKPTPARMRKIGYSILSACLLIAGGGLVVMDDMQEIFSPIEMKIIIGSLMAAGFIGKFITSFFTEENNDDTKDPAKP